MEQTMVNQLQLAYDSHPDRAEYESRAAKLGLELGTKSTMDWAKYFDSVNSKLVLTDKRCKYTLSNKLTSIMRLLALVKKSSVWQCKKAMRPRLTGSVRQYPLNGETMSTLVYTTIFFSLNFQYENVSTFFDPLTDVISQFSGVDSVEVMV